MEHGYSIEGSIGVEDTHRDIPILSPVETGIVFNPNGAIYAEAAKNSWNIVIERKNMIYELTKETKSPYKYIAENIHTGYPDISGDNFE